MLVITHDEKRQDEIKPVLFVLHDVSDYVVYTDINSNLNISILCCMRLFSENNLYSQTLNSLRVTVCNFMSRNISIKQIERSLTFLVRKQYIQRMTKGKYKVPTLDTNLKCLFSPMTKMLLKCYDLCILDKEPNLFPFKEYLLDENRFGILTKHGKKIPEWVFEEMRDTI